LAQILYIKITIRGGVYQSADVHSARSL